MPLRALVDGVDVIAPALSDAEWDALRERATTVILPCCGSEGYFRRSAMGTPHFAHKRGGKTCESAGETVYHLKAKADVVLACQQAGYSAVTEVAGEGWRADVLAVKGGVRIAFEVQWSFLRLEDAQYRQERYARDGVRGCWFFRNPPPALLRGDDLKALRDLPLFHLYANGDNTFSLKVNGQLRGLGEVVQGLLGGEIRFCETATAADVQTLEIAPFALKCPHCGGMTHVYRVEPLLTARCGRRFKAAPLEFRREVLAAVRALAKDQPQLRIGAFQDVVREDKKELRFGCFHCGGAISAEDIEMALYGATHLLHGERFPVTVQFQRAVTTRAAHWCFPDDGGFCCE
jgi:hypothetical protein